MSKSLKHPLPPPPPGGAGRERNRERRELVTSSEAPSRNRLAHVLDDKSMPASKINILWSMEESIPDCMPTLCLLYANSMPTLCLAH